MENQTAKHFVLQLGSLVSLYLSLAFLLVLLFGVVNLLFPDAAEGYWAIDGASSSVRIGFSMIIVFFPTYILLTRTVNKLRRKEKKGSYLSLTKWLIYLSLLVGGLALLIDLVVVVMAFLEGEITERFVLKALAVVLVIGSAFYYYLLDAKGYWLKNEKKSIYFGILVSLIVSGSLVLGVMNIEAPTDVREGKLDETQTQDLQSIQWQIQDYIVLNDEVPVDLSELDFRGNKAEAPEGRAEYIYNITEEGFSLCAEFKTESTDENFRYATSLDKEAVILNPNNWQHGIGEWCFERKVQITN